jgi:hypothetical protein
MASRSPTDAEIFFNYWRSRANFVSQLPPYEHHHEANVLAFAALDSLANLWALAFNKTGLKHARRFGEFLVACASLPDVFDRVSLPYLRWRAKTKPLDFPSNVLLTLQACGAPPQPPSPIRSKLANCARSPTTRP